MRRYKKCGTAFHLIYGASGGWYYVGVGLLDDRNTPSDPNPGADTDVTDPSDPILAILPEKNSLHGEYGKLDQLRQLDQSPTPATDELEIVEAATEAMECDYTAIATNIGNSLRAIPARPRDINAILAERDAADLAAIAERDSEVW